MSIVFFNQQFVLEGKAKLLATSQAALFGRGVFTSTLVDNATILFLEDHLKRLKKNAKTLGIEFAQPKIENIKDLILKNEAQRGKWRLRISVLVTESFSCFAFQKKPKTDLLMHLTPILEENKDKLSLCIYPQMISSSLCKIKTLSYLERFFLKDYAKKKKKDEVLLLGPGKEILESSFSNIFWLDKKSIYIPDEKLAYFEGITLKYVIKSALKEGFSLKKGFFQLKDIPKTANVYLCNSLKKIMPVAQIEKRVFSVKSFPLKSFEVLLIKNSLMI